MSKVLLVEDDINLREIYAARLSAEGHELVLAADGEEALSKAVSEKPQLILLDIMMPKISGFDVLDILRSTPETENTKVVMLSALSQESDKERGEQLGVDKYLIKSQITLEDVVETVKELVQDGGGGDGQSTSIVTTSSGRLPDENSDESQDDQPDQADQAAQNVAATKQSGQQSGQSKAKPNQAADEINDIDTQMQQNPDNQQQNQAQSQQDSSQTASNDGQSDNDSSGDTSQNQQEAAQSDTSEGQQKTASE